MHELKTRLYQYADKFATFWMFPQRFQHSSVLQITLIHSTISETQGERFILSWLNASRLEKHLDRGKTQC